MLLRRHHCGEAPGIFLRILGRLQWNLWHRIHIVHQPRAWSPESVTSKSLKKALNKGLPVRYSTNEQVAGNIEVLLESATAKRLGIKGSTATGLPAGTPKL